MRGMGIQYTPRGRIAIHGAMEPLLQEKDK